MVVCPFFFFFFLFYFFFFFFKQKTAYEIVDCDWSSDVCSSDLGVEAVVAALSGSDDELLGELADLTYHLLVVLAARGLTPEQVVDELKKRQGVSGLTEKASRG